jgi:hypothetical protein
LLPSPDLLKTLAGKYVMSGTMTGLTAFAHGQCFEARFQGYPQPIKVVVE